jgi:hypothetical protein
VVHCGKGEGYGFDADLIDAKQLSRNGLRDIIVGLGGKKDQRLKESHFIVQVTEVKQFTVSEKQKQIR